MLWQIWCGSALRSVFHPQRGRCQGNEKCSRALSADTVSEALVEQCGARCAHIVARCAQSVWPKVCIHSHLGDPASLWRSGLGARGGPRLEAPHPPSWRGAPPPRQASMALQAALPELLEAFGGGTDAAGAGARGGAAAAAAARARELVHIGRAEAACPPTRHVRRPSETNANQV